MRTDDTKKERCLDEIYNRPNLQHYEIATEAADRLGLIVPEVRTCPGKEERKLQDNCHRCHYYRPWVETSRDGELNRVCVDEEKRTIERCPHYEEPEKCGKFKPSTL